MIPKIIHQIWFQGEDKIPSKYNEYRDTWFKLHSDYKYQLWDDKKIIKLLETYYPYFLDTYYSYPYMHQKIDSAKYFILYTYGGLYIDMDMICLKKMDDFLNYDLVLSQLDDISCYKDKFCISMYVMSLGNLKNGMTINNGIILCSPNHYYIQQLIKNLIQAYQQTNTSQKVLAISNTTGPVFCSMVFEKNKSKLLNDSKIKIVSQKIFEPCLDRDNCDTTGAYTDHIMTKTWLSPFYKWIYPIIIKLKVVPFLNKYFLIIIIMIVYLIYILLGAPKIPFI